MQKTFVACSFYMQIALTPHKKQKFLYKIRKTKPQTISQHFHFQPKKKKAPIIKSSTIQREPNECRNDNNQILMDVDEDIVMIDRNFHFPDIIQK